MKALRAPKCANVMQSVVFGHFVVLGPPLSTAKKVLTMAVLDYRNNQPRQRWFGWHKETIFSSLHFAAPILSFSAPKASFTQNGFKVGHPTMQMAILVQLLQNSAQKGVHCKWVENITIFLEMLQFFISAKPLLPTKVWSGGAICMSELNIWFSTYSRPRDENWIQILVRNCCGLFCNHRIWSFVLKLSNNFSSTIREFVYKWASLQNVSQYIVFWSVLHEYGCIALSFVCSKRSLSIIVTIISFFMA